MAKRDPLTGGLMIKTQGGDAGINPLLAIARHAAGQMVSLAAHFGLSPAARARIAAGVSGTRRRASSKGCATAKKATAKRGLRPGLSHRIALLIVFAPRARCEVDQRAFAHEGDASPIAIDVPGGSFADEFAQRIAWAEARTFTYLNHGDSLRSLCRGDGWISFIRALHEFAISSLSPENEKSGQALHGTR
jgi:hypothetical protein